MSTAYREADARCANCGAPLSGPFCGQCGQAVKPLDPPVRHFAAEFAQELLDVDGRVPRSLRRLLFSPGFLTREHVEGRRVPWLSPLKLYLLASVAMFTVSALVGGLGEIRLTTSEDVRHTWPFGVFATQFCDSTPKSPGMRHDRKMNCPPLYWKP